MFVFFVLMLMLAVFVESSDEVISEDSMAMDESNAGMVLENKDLRN